MFKDIQWIVGAGVKPEKLRQITPEKIKFLPNCSLKVAQKIIASGNYCFTTTPATNSPCTFTYQDNTFQVFLGLEATANNLLTYDKGIDPVTGRGIWGALLDAYRFTKLQDFASDLINC